MARRKKRTTTSPEEVSGDDPTTTNAESVGTQKEITMPNETESQASFTVIDYRGTTGVDDEGRTIDHKSSPRVFLIADPSVRELIIQPGANIVDAAEWKVYKADPAVKKLLREGALIDLGTELPSNDHGLRDLIERTIDRKALDWIAGQEKLGKGRDRFLKMCDLRASRTTVCSWERGSWVATASNAGIGARA